jgi:NADP-dependent 3-hydroxy acid dehydrogenase YdfG
VKADVSNQDAVGAMVSTVIDELGGIDVLVNNAGVVLPFRFEEPDYSKWQRMVDVNMKGILLCSRAVLDSMRRRGGAAGS